MLFNTTVGDSGSVFAKGRDNLILGVLFLLVFSCILTVKVVNCYKNDHCNHKP